MTIKGLNICLRITISESNSLSIYRGLYPQVNEASLIYLSELEVRQLDVDDLPEL